MEDYLKEYYRKIGLNITYYRKRANLTQQQLAERLGVDNKTISRMETAAQRTTLDFIFKISRELDIKPSKFLEFKDD
ncbi:MAG: helix-turn-helix domain-containing protein [Oscillospiraceae bacterium]|jgi:transcriptional regulator with XRE-family HTH domain